jgi:hypothetical protein
MPRSREELVEALRACVRLHEAGVPLPGLVSDLTEVIEFLDSLEEREEWRVVGTNDSGLDHPVGHRYRSLKTARQMAEFWRDPSCWPVTVRIQRHTAFETPWTDVEEGTDGC